MRVARLHRAGEVLLGEEADPVPGEGEVLVRVTSVGICGSDLHWYDEGSIGDARLAAPLVLGHEMAGVVASGPRAGTRVAIDPAVPCEACRACRTGWRNLCPQVVFAGHGGVDGGMRQAMAWPERVLHELPDDLSDDAGALLEPLGVALHAVDLAHLRLGHRVVVVGAGPIGIYCAVTARLAGATEVVVVEPLAHRRRLALDLGADRAVAPEEAEELRDRFDVVIEVAGTDAAIDVALRSASVGGRVVLVGIPDSDTTTFRASLARRKGLTLVLSRRMDEAYPRAIALAVSGAVPLGELVSHRFGLDEVAEAMHAAAHREGHKVIVSPTLDGPD